jgi:hypothetical protein
MKLLNPDSFYLFLNLRLWAYTASISGCFTVLISISLGLFEMGGDSSKPDLVILSY